MSDSVDGEDFKRGDMFLILRLMVAWVFARICEAMALSRGRSTSTWFWIGAFTGLLGAVILYFLPSLVKEKDIHREKVKHSDVSKIEAATSVEDFVLTEEDVETMVPFVGWFIVNGEKQVEGPFTVDCLRAKWKEEVISFKTWVWHESIKDWKKIESIHSLTREMKSISI